MGGVNGTPFSCYLIPPHHANDCLFRPGVGVRSIIGRGMIVHSGRGPQWGQVCFTAISSNHTCHHGVHCSQFSVPDFVL